MCLDSRSGSASENESKMWLSCLSRRLYSHVKNWGIQNEHGPVQSEKRHALFGPSMSASNLPFKIVHFPRDFSPIVGPGVWPNFFHFRMAF